MTETYFGVKRVCELLAVDRPVSHRQVYRWVKTGVSVKGRTIKLDAVRLPGSLGFTMAGVQRFIDEMTAAHFKEARPASGGPARGRPAERVKRCAPSEIGTYPLSRRHGSRSAVDGFAARSPDNGRDDRAGVGVTAEVGDFPAGMRRVGEGLGSLVGALVNGAEQLTDGIGRTLDVRA